MPVVQVVLARLPIAPVRLLLDRARHSCAWAPKVRHRYETAFHAAIRDVSTDIQGYSNLEAGSVVRGTHRMPLASVPPARPCILWHPGLAGPERFRVASKFELTKSVEARKLNPRTGIPTTDPPVSVPFGAIITDIQQDRDDAKFYYLGQYLQCAYDVLERAIVPVGQSGPNANAASAAAASATPAPAVPPEPEAEGPKLAWQALRSTQGQCARAKVPGGWLISLGSALTFYPDPAHEWDGTSLE